MAIGDAVNLSMRCRYPRELPEGRYNPQWRHIPAYISSPAERTPFLFLAEIFLLVNGPTARMERFEARTDFMGGLQARMEMAGELARMSLEYEQRIDDEWQHVERLIFRPTFETRGQVGLIYDLDMTANGEVGITLTDAEMDLVERVIRLAEECFNETVLGPGLEDELRIKSILAQSVWRRRPPGAAVGAGGKLARGGVERLEQALDQERDAYMEWHDGPDFSAEAEAVAGLNQGELKEAGEMISARLEAGYDVHLGQAAVLLGKRGDRLPQMVTALESALRREKQFSQRVHLACNVLELYRSPLAQMALRQAISEGGDWSTKVEAICSLKSSIERMAPGRPIGELLPPETAEVLLSEVASNDYLVRYHAADTLLKAAGEAEGMTDKGEIFGLICGSDRTAQAPPGAEDRKGFEKAADKIKETLTQKRII